MILHVIIDSDTGQRAPVSPTESSVAADRLVAHLERTTRRPHHIISGTVDLDQAVARLLAASNVRRLPARRAAISAAEARRRAWLTTPDDAA